MRGRDYETVKCPSVRPTVCPILIGSSCGVWRVCRWAPCGRRYRSTAMRLGWIETGAVGCFADDDAGSDDSGRTSRAAASYSRTCLLIVVVMVTTSLAATSHVLARWRHIGSSSWFDLFTHCCGYMGLAGSPFPLSKTRQSYITLRPLSGDALWWARLTIRRGVKSVLPPAESLWVYAFFASPVPDHSVQTWRHPKNRKYITYRNAARGEPSAKKSRRLIV